MSEDAHEGFYVGVYGPGSGESLDICVRRTLHFLELLKPIDPTFAQWYAKGWTIEEALQHRLDGDPAELKRCFKHSAVAPHHNSLSAWNGLDDDDASAFSISWGGTSSPYVCDANVFKPHETGPTGDRIIQVEPMTRLLRAMAIAWDPRVGIVISHRHRDSTFDGAKSNDKVGWINYFSHKLGALPPLPSPVRTELVEDKGSLVILTPERWSTSNPEHVALSLRVSAELKNAGVLRPILQPASRDRP